MVIALHDKLGVRGPGAAYPHVPRYLGRNIVVSSLISQFMQEAAERDISPSGVAFLNYHPMGGGLYPSSMQL